MSSITDSTRRGILLNDGKHHNTDHHNVTFTEKDQLIFVEPLEEVTPDEREKILNEVIPSQWKDEIELLKCKLKEGNNANVNEVECTDNNDKKNTEEKISK
uniref:Uncharacterized protein n=1 Tax=Parastrongyloides trichosuri TaxID=131310 RepID=A0A0N4Z0K9_PARTI